MLRINQLKLPVGHTQDMLVKRIREVLGCREEPEWSIVRRSLDARKKPQLFYVYTIDVRVSGEARILKKCKNGQLQSVKPFSYVFPVKAVGNEPRPVIIGMGPAGLFCGYMLAKAGFKPILLERGKAVTERKKDVERFWETGILDPESNVQFGEGGAGTFSDGKLNTLVKDKYGRNREVLRIFTEHGAPEEILYDYKPHIGTDLLSQIVMRMRQHMIDLGAEIRFETKVTEVLSRDGRLCGLRLHNGEILKTDCAVLAIGHSARDTFYMLHEKGVRMEAKPFAVGFRVEHPQELINWSQYGTTKAGELGSAVYKVTAAAEGQRGVYSFCMCPGGYVVNASSEEGCLAVNGMSYSRRDGQNANSAIIVTISPEDYGAKEDPLSGVEFQRRIERNAYQAAGGKVPVERYGDFKRAVCGESEPEEATKEDPVIQTVFEDMKPAVRGQWAYAPVHEILPEELNRAFVGGMEEFGRKLKGFARDEVLLEGVESRTSSPVRIMRDETLQASLLGLYPCGEGAGYAGGITSAAMDGILVAELVAGELQRRCLDEQYVDGKAEDQGALSCKTQ